MKVLKKITLYGIDLELSEEDNIFYFYWNDRLKNKSKNRQEMYDFWDLIVWGLETSEGK